jgi:hypothetical protein
MQLLSPPAPAFGVLVPLNGRVVEREATFELFVYAVRVVRVNEGLATLTLSQWGPPG